MYGGHLPVWGVSPCLGSISLYGECLFVWGEYPYQGSISLLHSSVWGHLPVCGE